MQGDEELLAELATVDEASAYIPTAVDQDAGVVPAWAELILTVKRTDDGTLKPSWPLNARMPLRRHDGELIIEVLDQVLHPNRGGGAVEQMWDQMDLLVQRIQRRVERGKSPRKEDVIKAKVLSWCIAVVTNPMAPDVEAVKELAMERYEDEDPNTA